MVKPKWLALLVGALIVVVLFVLLGRWQLNAAFESSTAAVDSETYEQTVPLGELIAPGEGVTDEDVARPIEMSGWLVPGDFTVVSNRVQSGETGWWVVGHLAVADDGVTNFAPDNPADASAHPGLAVAVGWAATEQAALAAAESLNASSANNAREPSAFSGKLEALQEPVIDRDSEDPTTVGSMAVGQLINLWQEPAVSYYAAWALLQEGVELPAELEPIAAVAIDESFQLDLLNIFYAIEWAVFAIMAIYIWWRLVRDDYLAEQAQDPEADLAEEIRREKLRQLADARTPDAASPTTTSTQERN